MVVYSLVNLPRILSLLRNLPTAHFEIVCFTLHQVGMTVSSFILIKLFLQLYRKRNEWLTAGFSS
jgi:hypothetical protein